MARVGEKVEVVMELEIVEQKIRIQDFNKIKRNEPIAAKYQENSKTIPLIAKSITTTFDL